MTCTEAADKFGISTNSLNHRRNALKMGAWPLRSEQLSREMIEGCYGLSLQEAAEKLEVSRSSLVNRRKALEMGKRWPKTKTTHSGGRRAHSKRVGARPGRREDTAEDGGASEDEEEDEEEDDDAEGSVCMVEGAEMPMSELESTRSEVSISTECPPLQLNLDSLVTCFKNRKILKSHRQFNIFPRPLWRQVLLNGWKELRTDDGTVYYWKEGTPSSQWHHPGSEAGAHQNLLCCDLYFTATTTYR